MRYPLRVVLAFGLVAALAGCAAPPVSSGGSTNSTTPTAPTTTPVPAQTQASEPSHLVISSTDIKIYLQDGSLAETINYFDPIDPAVERLTELFGAAPAVNTYDGTGAAEYEWPGFRLGTDGPATPIIGPELSVRATAAEVNNIQVGTTDGTRVGEDLRPISAADPMNSSVYPNGTGETLSVKIGIVPVEPGDSERAFYTTLSADPADGIIDQIHAPGKNFE
ncbi:hypothetical protein [Cryobacterium sp. PH29-G1]|uniref:hypothetical protein n=1 Tax=Cryobacterium sp. PH29-G1 TaxID=3046211 RepID=UPI0024BAFBFC|nr:hypothetical protein [Cryobacterium sp. PH29-G1]MDJ0349742.1 hypothetical protein [Cryobacterium sp. PH29-G1]